MSNLEKSADVSPPTGGNGSSAGLQSNKTVDPQGLSSKEVDGGKPVAFGESTISRPQTYGKQPEFDYPSVEELERYLAAEDDPVVEGYKFNDESLRRGFIRKVYGILSVNENVFDHEPYCF